jgi:hypothetical protein
MADEENKERMVSFFYQHIVPIYFCFEKEDKKRQFILTSFVFSVSDYWFLITAGHCIKQIKEELIDKGWTLSICSLIDFLGINARFKDPIPFSFDINKAFYFPEINDDYSFDYGVYPLSRYFKELLLSNNIQSLNEEVWKKQPVHIDKSALLGIPSELLKFDQGIEIGSSFIYADIVEEKPDGFKDVSMPQIYAKIQMDNGIDSIEGMSGGPLFGFRKYDNGEMRYWLLGLQSRWLPESHFIAVCPTKYIGLFLESYLSKETHI